MEKTIFTVYIIQCFDMKTEEGRLIDSVVVQVIAKTEEEAMKKAKEYVNKPNYRVSEVIENYV